VTLGEFARVALEEGLTEEAIAAMWVGIPMKAALDPMREESLRQMLREARQEVNEEADLMRGIIREIHAIINN